MIKRPPRNAVTSQRRVTKSPFNPLYNPDLQPAIATTPGFPPDTEAFCVSTFTGRFALMSDFYYRALAGQIINAPEGFDYSPPNANPLYGVMAPVGFRLIIQHILIGPLLDPDIQIASDNGSFPFMLPGGVTQRHAGLDGCVTPIIAYDGVPYNNLSAFPFSIDTQNCFQLIYAPMSIDCYVRVESGSFLTVEFQQPVDDINALVCDGALVEFRGQIEATEGNSLPTLGMSRDAVPVSERKGLILEQKKVTR